MVHMMFAKTLLSWLITFVCATGGHADSFFTRNERLDNKGVCDSPINILTSVPLDKCARQCHNAQSCASFFYNRNVGKCELFSRIYVDPEDTSSEPGNVNFWKQGDQGICDVPAAIANGRVLYLDGQVEGSNAEFVCDDFHIPTAEAGTCDTSGTWVGLDNPCKYKLQGSYKVPAVGKIKPGSCVIVMATPTDGTKFRFLLRKDETNYNIQVRVVFTRQEIVRNTKINDDWTKPVETDAPFWPFVVNQEFNLTVCAEETMYRGYIDNTEMFTYDYLSPISEIAAVYMDGNVALRKIRFFDSEWNRCKGSP